MRNVVFVLCGLLMTVVACNCSAPGTPVHTTLEDPPGITAQRINGPGPRYDNGEPTSHAGAQDAPRQTENQ